jgi:hypothetical protein
MLVDVEVDEVAAEGMKAVAVSLGLGCEMFRRNRQENGAVPNSQFQRVHFRVFVDLVFAGIAQFFLKIAAFLC